MEPRIGALTLKGECWSTHGRWPLAMNCTTAMASNPKSNYENTRPAERLFNKLKPNANFQAETSNRKYTGMMLQKLQQNLTRPTVQLTLRFDSNVRTLAAWDHLRISLPSNTQLDLAAVVIRTKHLEVVPSSLQRHNTSGPPGARWFGWVTNLEPPLQWPCTAHQPLRNIQKLHADHADHAEYRCPNNTQVSSLLLDMASFMWRTFAAPSWGSQAESAWNLAWENLCAPLCKDCKDKDSL